MPDLNHDRIEDAFQLLGERMELDSVVPVCLVVCGGSALIARHLVARNTTRDIDVLALADPSGEGLLDPEPLPHDLMEAAEQTGADLGLPSGWLNNGPSRGDGGLYRSGLPDGLLERAEKRTYGHRLSVCFIGRLDQIYFKLPAAIDQGGGRHLDDLLALQPTGDELEAAARWARTYDPSDGFALLLRQFFRSCGHDDIAERL